MKVTSFFLLRDTKATLVSLWTNLNINPKEYFANQFPRLIYWDLGNAAVVLSFFFIELVTRMVECHKALQMISLHLVRLWLGAVIQS